MPRRDIAFRTNGRLSGDRAASILLIACEQSMARSFRKSSKVLVGAWQVSSQYLGNMEYSILISVLIITHRVKCKFCTWGVPFKKYQSSNRKPVVLVDTDMSLIDRNTAVVRLGTALGPRCNTWSKAAGIHFANVE